MKKISHHIPFYFLIIFISACGSSAEVQQHPLRLQFVNQILQTCEASDAYYKKVVDLGENPIPNEDTLYAKLPEIVIGEGIDGEDSLGCMLLQEVQYAFERIYDLPRTRDLFEVVTSSDTTIAKLTEEAEGSSDLIEQKILMGSDQKILFVASTLHKKNWLYSLDIVIEVEFDANGIYKQHKLEVRNEVPIIGDSFASRIEGTLR